AERHGRPPDRRDPLGAVREVDRLVEVVGEDADHLAEAERHDRQVVAVQAQHGEAEEDPGARRDHETDEQEGVEPPRGEGEGVPAEDEVGLRRTGDRPRVGAHGDVREEQRPLEEQEDEYRAREDRDGPRRDADQADREDRVGHARPLTTSPRSPLGRKIRIRIRIEKAKMSLYSAPNAPAVRSDRYEAAKASSRPSTRPPSIAPGMLPMPPSTAAVNALSPGMKP